MNILATVIVHHPISVYLLLGMGWTLIPNYYLFAEVVFQKLGHFQILQSRRSCNSKWSAFPISGPLKHNSTLGTCPLPVEILVQNLITSDYCVWLWVMLLRQYIKNFSMCMCVWECIVEVGGFVECSFIPRPCGRREPHSILPHSLGVRLWWGGTRVVVHATFILSAHQKWGVQGVWLE